MIRRARQKLSRESRIPVPYASPSSPAPGSYGYKELPSSSSFRILELLPGEGTDPIAYCLHFADWENPPEYEAISYAWGDANSTIKAICDGRTQEMTDNLWKAFSYLRLKDRRRILWADAICIDQSNLGERRHQVNSMRKIYQNASRVLVWLGEDEDRQGVEAMGFIEQLSNAICRNAGIEIKDLIHVDNLSDIGDSSVSPWRLCPDPTPRLWRSLLWLFARPWFSRIWVIQEVNAGPSVLAICGTSTLYWQCLALVADLITNSSRIYSTHRFGNTHCFLAGYMQTVSFRRPCPALDVLDYSRDFLATDPRDKIYALLGLPSFAEQCKPLDADYTKSKQQVFAEFTEAVIRNSNSLAILSHVQHSANRMKIYTPSWIPRWEVAFRAMLLNRTSLNWNAHNSTLPKISIDIKTYTINIAGIKLDTITEVERFNAHEIWPLEPPLNGKVVKEFWEDRFGITPESSIEELEAYSMVITAGIDGAWERANPVSHAESFRSFLSVMHEPNPRRKYTHHYPADTHLFVSAAWRLSCNRDIFRTEKGYIGLGPKYLQRGDVVAVLFGGGVPFVLRPMEGYYHLVGECFVNGVMDGEGIEGGVDGREEVFEIR